MSDTPDKQLLYGRYQAVEDWNRKRLEWQDELRRKAAHKALDIGAADDMGDINANHFGLGASELAAVLQSVLPRDSQAAAPSQPPPPKRSLLKPLLIAAGLAGGGLGVGMGLQALPDVITALRGPETPHDPPPQQQQPADFTDTDTTFELRLGRPPGWQPAS